MKIDLIGKVVYGPTTFNDSSGNLTTKMRPCLVIAQNEDKHSLTCVIFSSNRKKRLEPYDLFIDASVYDDLCLKKSCYIRCGRIITLNKDMLDTDSYNRIKCFEFENKYPYKFKEVMSLVDKYIQSNSHLVNSSIDFLRDENIELRKECRYLKNNLIDIYQGLSLMFPLNKNISIDNRAILESAMDSIYDVLYDTLTIDEFESFENTIKPSKQVLEKIVEKRMELEKIKNKLNKLVK